MDLLISLGTQVSVGVAWPLKFYWSTLNHAHFSPFLSGHSGTSEKAEADSEYTDLDPSTAIDGEP